MRYRPNPTQMLRLQIAGHGAKLERNRKRFLLSHHGRRAQHAVTSESRRTGAGDAGPSKDLSGAADLRFGDGAYLRKQLGLRRTSGRDERIRRLQDGHDWNAAGNYDSR